MKLGTQTHFKQGWNTRLLAEIDDAGIGAIRDSIAWHKVETSKGKYDFSLNNADWITKAVAKGLDVLVVFDPRNSLYDQGFSVYSPEGMKAYANFIVATLKAFPGITAIEIGNEYNGDDFVDGPIAQAPKAERDDFYHQLVTAVDQALDAAGIDTKIIGGSTHSIPVDYFAKLKANGTLDMLDGISIHPYTTPAEQFADQIELLRKVIGPDMEIHVTEFSNIFDRPEEASAYIAKMVSVMAASDIDTASWYAFAKQTAYPHRELFDQTTNKTTLGGHTFALLEDMMANGAQVDAIEIDAYTHFYRFGTNAAIIWGENRSVALASGVEAFDLAGNRITDFANISPDMPVVLRSSSPITAASLTLGSNYLLADSFHDFDVTNYAKNGAGFEGPWSYFAENGNGRTWSLETQGGDIGGGTLWTPFLGLDWLNPLRVTSTALLPVDFSPKKRADSEYAVVERYTAEQAGTVTIRGSWDVANDTVDGVELRIEVNNKVQFQKVIFDAANGHQFEITLNGIKLKAGDTIDFVIDSRGSSTGDATTRRIQIFSDKVPAAILAPAKTHDPVMPVEAVDETPANAFDHSGAAKSVSVIGTAAADVILGGNAADKLDGRGGLDAIYGGDGNDVIYTDGNAVDVSGGSGYDTVFFSGSVAASLDLYASDIERVYGSSQGDNFDAFENRASVTIEGGLGDDFVQGGKGADRLAGDGGNDRLYGSNGSDTLSGGIGNDVLAGGTGNDRLSGGSGNDIFLFDDRFGKDVITDFAQGDVIDLSGIKGISKLSDLAIIYNGKKATITIGDDTITLEGVKGGLDADDFLF